MFGVAHICNSPPPPGPEEELRKCRLVSVSLVFPPIYVSVQVKTGSFLHEVLYSSCEVYAMLFSFCWQRRAMDF